MKRKNAPLLFVVSILILTTLVASPVSALHVGDKAPDFTLTDIDGNTFSLSDYGGMVVLLEFFYSPCPTCQEEVAELKVVYDTFGQDLLVIISISKEDDATLIQFRDDYQIPWIIASDPGEVVHGKYGVTPGSFKIFIIDQESIIRFIHGGKTMADTLISELEQLGIPEFTPAMILPLFVIVTLVAVVLGKKWSMRHRGSLVVE